jgi:ATP phosphoribosyltransferase regulatory subunit
VKLPAGVRDWLPHELARKRDVELIIRAVFGRWAYEEIQTPTFERFDVLEKGLGYDVAEQAYRFADRRATALALRPEMTTPIARLVTTRMREAPLPLRLSYVTPVFRYYDQPQEGRLRPSKRSMKSACATRASTSTMPRSSTASSPASDSKPTISRVPRRS